MAGTPPPGFSSLTGSLGFAGSSERIGRSTAPDEMVFSGSGSGELRSGLVLRSFWSLYFLGNIIFC